MKDKNINVLSTRPLDEVLVKKAQERQISIDSISFIKTENIINSYISEEVKALAAQAIIAVFTSMNGAQAVIKILAKDALQPKWKIYCTGAATQSLLREYFTAVEISGTGKNATELSETIISDNVKKVIFFCGDQRRDELPEHLQQNNIEVKEIVVYETKQIPIKIEKEYNAILFYSPSAVKSFFSVNSISANAVLFSIGNTTAEEIKKNCNNKIIVSDFPAKDKLIEEATAYFDTIKSHNDRTEK